MIGNISDYVAIIFAESEIESFEFTIDGSYKIQCLLASSGTSFAEQPFDALRGIRNLPEILGHISSLHKNSTTAESRHLASTAAVPSRRPAIPIDSGCESLLPALLSKLP